MRVLLSTIGSRGDVQPLAALATRLVALGQQVRLCVPPDFREWVESLGMPVVSIGPQLRRPAASTSSAPAPTAAPALTPELRRQLAEASVATQFETIASAAEDCDIIVAATALQIAARSVAEKKAIPYVFAAYCPNVLPSPHHAPPPLPSFSGQPPPVSADNGELWLRNAQRFSDLFGGALNAHRASIGLPPVSDVQRYVLSDRPWLAADATLAPWPDPSDDAVVQTGAWILPDERPLESALEQFLDAGEPPIYFGFGSMRAPGELAGVMIESARALGRRIIVSRGWADLAPVDDEPDCLAIGEVNQQSIFTRVAAVVHHGGAGTTTTAAMAGAPQVIVPQIYDQHYFARRVEELGMGTAHAAGTPTAASLTVALERSLQPEIAVRARSIASAMRRDGAEAAAQLLMSGLA